MRVRRTEILPIAESAIRDALREAVREALRDVGIEASPRTIKPAMAARPSRPRSASFAELSDEQAWERFDSIRFARFAGMTHTQAS